MQTKNKNKNKISPRLTVSWWSFFVCQNYTLESDYSDNKNNNNNNKSSQLGHPCQSLGGMVSGL